MQAKTDTPYKLVLGTQNLISSKKKDKLQGIEFLNSLYKKKLSLFIEVIQQYQEELLSMLCSNDFELVTAVLNMFETFCKNEEIWIYTYYSFLFYPICCLLAHHIRDKDSFNSKVIVHKVKSAFYQLQETCQLHDCILELISVLCRLSEEKEIFNLIQSCIMTIVDQVSVSFALDENFYPDLYETIRYSCENNPRLIQTSYDIMVCISIKEQHNFESTFDRVDSDTKNYICELIRNGISKLSK